MEAMTDKQFWQAVYIAAIRAGKDSWEAKDIANDALKQQPGLAKARPY